MDAERRLIFSDDASRGQRHPLRRISLTLLGFLAVLAVVLWGNDRIPADPTEPLKLSGTPASSTLPRSTVRLATFNIHSTKGRDGRADLQRTIRSLRGLDIVALQEVRGGWTEGGIDQATLLGRELEMASLFAPFERRWWNNSFGSGLLTRVALTGFHRIPLPGDDPNRFRNAVLARIRHRGTSINILCAHLDNHRDHDRQLREVIHLFLSLEAPVVLMGDLNTAENDPQLVALRSHPSVTGCIGESSDDGPALRGVDWIVLRGLRCVSRECRDLGASDHPVICAEVELIAATGSDHRLAEPASRR